MMALPAVQVDSIGKTYAGGVRALEHVSSQVAEGETFGILGANGAGKTTLIRIVSTLMRPSHGRVTLFGGTEGAAMAVVGGMFVTGYYFHAMEAWLLGPITLRGFLGAPVAGATAMSMLAGATALILIRLVLGLSPAEPALALALAFVMMPMMFFGCTFYGWDSLAWPWNALALLMPTTYLSEALRATYGSSASLHAGPWLLAGAIAILGGLAALSDIVFRRRFRDFPW
jgi:energy-coupling factor transporter ATP-binding protein EcfA2